MTNLFTGQVAIVTGGGSGIGEALCLELARRGARVVVADINADNARRVAAAIGSQATASTVNVAIEPDVTRLVEDTAAAHGRLDYMFNNAGFAIGGDARDLTLDHWRRVLDVDLYGVLYGMHAAYPIMARQGFGHIVNTSSAAAFSPLLVTPRTARPSTPWWGCPCRCAWRVSIWGSRSAVSVPGSCAPTSTGTRKRST